MATFYVMPARAFVGEWFAGYLRSCFPGLEWSRDAWPAVAELLTQSVADRPNMFVVHREDLPADADLGEALAEGFGAEPGDDVVEVHPASAPGKWQTRRWRLNVVPERVGNDL